jgi:hypothetical protein
MSSLQKWFPGLLLLIIIVVSTVKSLENNRKSRNIIFSDQEGYYMYLPAVFIYGGFENYPVRTKQQFAYFNNTKKVFTKYTCGVAILQMPFFLLAHAYCKLFNLNPDGFNPIYRSMIDFATIFYVAIGFVLLYHLLKNQFQKPILLTALICIFFGTNLYYYTLIDALMSHAYSFFLISVFLYITPLLYRQPTYRNALIFGFLLGFIILLRPTNFIALLYFILYNITDKPSMNERILFFKKHAKKFLISSICALIVFVPQCMYWYHLSGNFILYSYDKEGFIYWNSPKIWKVLFGLWNGWILYSPMVVFALAGIYFGIIGKVKNSLASLVILAAASYVFGSWWAWWFGGAYGHRCFIDFYPMLVLSFSAKNKRITISKKNSVWGLTYCFSIS